jgi:hypothetical protein
MSTKVKLLACLAGAAIPCLLAVAAHSADETYTVTTIIPVPGGLFSFDIGFDDANIRTYVLADRGTLTPSPAPNSGRVDVVNTNTNVLTRQLTGCGGNVPFPTCTVFVGVQTGANRSGPNGVIIVDQREVWAADGVSSTHTTSKMYAINLHNNNLIATMDTGGTHRADELCEDVKGEVVLVANDDVADNFVTFWSTETYTQLGKTLKLDGADPNGTIKLTPPVSGTTKVAANGIEQCKFNPRTGSYYLAIPATTVFTTGGPTAGSPGPGVVLVISRKAPFHVERTITVPSSTGCSGPQGLAIGPRHEIQLGCGGGGANSIIIDERSVGTATVIATQLGEGGADEVWYNPGDNSYFIARSGAAKLGVWDAGGNESKLPQGDSDVATTVGSHSVAADMLKNQIYVPVRGNTVPNTCPSDPTGTAGCATLCGVAHSTAAAQGCIAVFTAPNDDKCLAQGMPVLDHDDGDDPVFMRTRCRDHDDDDREARR